MNAQRGNALIEVLVVVAIILTVSAIAWGFSTGDRMFAAQSAATIFDVQLAHARAIAATGGSAATLVFTPASPGRGTLISLAPDTDGVPPETLRVDVSETSLGAPPFSLAIDPSGHATASQPCPAAGGYTLTFSAGPASASRFLPCPLVVAGPPEPPGTVPP
ncbi:MAG TPA: type II secretion system protein [Candidatus Rubrimentiphilum sp.]|nr:type II secretion system protein [Candidatus Rubrimentiphilum sp.]